MSYNDTATTTTSTTSTQLSEPESTCPTCETALETDPTTRDRHCPDCGYIVNTPNLNRQPKPNYSSDQGGQRTSTTTTQTLHDKGLSTTISSNNRDGYGNLLSVKRQKKIYNLRKWNRRSQTHGREKATKKGLNEIKRMGSALGLPKSVREIAAVIFRRLHSEDLIKGNSVEGIATASLYTATHKEDLPRSFEEFKPVSHVSKKRIRRCQIKIRRELDIEIDPTTPENYIPRYGDWVDASQKHISEAQRLANHLTKTTHISGRKPSSLAAASIYAASLTISAGITQSEIAKTCPVCKATIRDNYKLLLDVDPKTDLTLNQLDELTIGEIRDSLQ